ncbi:hypothetical protein EG68_10863 [Paragonimus skrjabini miyazakii]|uniref:RUS family member 1 n=1 Tax=Paragonimus skrjabini miyazakii TaxID=59628 RepID=A0A8S9YG03_9TREM|nr:hypothetical protein EG68_10863 [Paragonimus skrjabini miyazakii]
MHGHKVAFEAYGHEAMCPYWGNSHKRRSLMLNTLKRFPTLTSLKNIFLPKGYPQSVTPDYLEYQIWDTIQALASSVTGALAAQALLVGVGVGNVEATILSASLSWMLKDGSGMIGKIVFVGWQGSYLDCDCKRWRFLADILNDMALLMELASPSFPAYFTLIVCAANILKSVVSVAGGATRAAVTYHQARDNNVADVAAKDGSQETLSNLLALLFNLSLVYFVTEKWGLIWFGFFVLTAVHLYANYRAVRCLQLTTFNRNRFSIAVNAWLTRRIRFEKPAAPATFPSVAWVNSEESVLGSASAVRLFLGCALHDIPEEGQMNLSDLIQVFLNEKYLLYCPDWFRIFNEQALHHIPIYIALVKDCEPSDQLLAVLHAELLAFLNHLPTNFALSEEFETIRTAKTVVEFSRASLEVSQKLLSELTQGNSALIAPQWNLNALHFCADEWRCMWAN